MAKAIAVQRISTVATTVGDNHVVELVAFTLEDDDEPSMTVAEVITFRGNQIREIRPY